MDKKKYYIFALVVIIIAVLALFLFLSAKKMNERAASERELQEQNAAGLDWTEVVDEAESRSTVSEFGIETPFQEVITPEEIPDAALKMTVSESGFSPSEFKVRSGQKITLAISAPESGPHVFMFLNFPMLNLTAMIFEGETQLIEFIAPEPGVYDFRDDIPANRANTGQMVVE